MDEELDAAERSGQPSDPYPLRLVALAASRFDVWARRVQAVVQSPEALDDYQAWLAAYVANWLGYVADTCPKVDVGDELRARLASRAQHWVAESGRTLQPVEESRQ